MDVFCDTVCTCICVCVCGTKLLSSWVSSRLAANTVADRNKNSRARTPVELQQSVYISVLQLVLLNRHRLASTCPANSMYLCWLRAQYMSYSALDCRCNWLLTLYKFCLTLNTVYTHCASVHQAAKSVADLLRVAWRKVVAAYRRVYDSHHLQADCQELGSAPEPYAR